jgi:hypothetical protein
MTDQYRPSTEDAAVAAETDVVVAAGSDDGNKVVI